MFLTLALLISSHLTFQSGSGRTFALIVELNGLSIDSSWSRSVPIKMNRDQRSWFNEVLKGRNLIWSEVRKIIVKTYDAQDVAQELEYMDQLLSLKMVPAESIEAFTDRFQRIRRAAKWDDNIQTASIYKRTLPAFLRQEVSRSFQEGIVIQLVFRI
ncbi:hypothetical protein G6F66_012260 [Rhizopus arrhizus]|nr:hypothetical protein G6F23_013486 [Rhizopus arrhizus]KAG1277544.1 hypothetical protein G6F66_012260 [Rhizopus arrhizus]